MADAVVDFAHVYPGVTLAFTVSAEVGDVVIVMPVSGSGGNATASDDKGNVYNHRWYQAGIITTRVECLTALVQNPGILTITVSNKNDMGFAAWLVRGPTSHVPHAIGGAYGGGNPLTASLTTTVTCSLFIAYGNETRDGWTSFTEGAAITPYGNHDTGHIDANGYILNLPPGNYNPGANVTDPYGENVIVALFLPASSGAGTNYEQTITDSEGLTDSTTRIAEYARSLADSESVTDSLSRVAAYLRDLADNEGVTDAATRTMDFIRSLAEAEGLADGTTRIVDFIRDVTDAEGLSDNLLRAATILREIVDSVGMTDDVTKNLFVTSFLAAWLAMQRRRRQ
jgi:hypothetical protein